ncbi:hypothetical protein [Nocardioides sp.]|uniref:hypothetical protein n=1 Tax=Nocardioides sp. TaxID=35761 RepID=UPI0035275763
MSRRIFAGMHAGAAVQPPDISDHPVAEAVAALNEFQPEALLGYPTNIALLAAEQQAGRLRISPTVVGTGSEVQTADHAERIHDAWGVRPGTPTSPPRRVRWPSAVRSASACTSPRTW